jgi:hypothetical protein
MSFRAKVSTVALTAAACMMLAPAALASTHGPAQVTGKQLKSALLPASDFVAGYTVSEENDSGSKLEHQTLYNLPSMSCSDFWLFIGTVGGFGDTAFAGDLVVDKTGQLTPEEIISQSVYQFASTKAAASFYGKVNAKYHACPSVKQSDGSGGSVQYTVHSQSKQRVGGHQALQIVEYTKASTTPSVSLPTYLLWTIDGTDVYLLNTEMITPGSPQPSQSSLTLKLIARVGALR